MFATLLIANRGEIACRVIATARAMGIATVAVYSDADAQALHVSLADRAVRLGPAPAAESYLDIGKIVQAARDSGADAVHPGYGFLSENAAFAEACEKAGVVFVGPPPGAIRTMGLKNEAKALMQQAGVPVVPGYHGTRQDGDLLRATAYEIGYPVLIKPVAGGGGKGMRRVDKQIAFDDALAAARREAASAFGDERVLIEKFIASPRHIEVQIFADAHGNVVHLFERDCSVQRRHQKVIEEAPAPGMTAGLRARMGEAAIAAARAAGYQGAGTVEFIVDGAAPLHDGTPFHFLEMNTRLQVEHPVTEAVTGIDLVEWQLRIAAGEPLPCDQNAIRLAGHAAEVRLYAEDPENGFLPSSGRVHAFSIPGGEDLRIDTGIEAGNIVSPHYDPMLAKVIAHGKTRDAALACLARALEETVVAGPKTNLGLLRRILADEAFMAGGVETGFLDAWPQQRFALPQAAADIAAAAGLLALGDALWEEGGTLRAASGLQDVSPWSVRDGFALGERPAVPYRIVVDGVESVRELAWSDGAPHVVAGADAEDAGADVTVTLPGRTDDGAYVLVDGFQRHVTFAVRDISAADAGAADRIARAPMHGRIAAVHVAPGDRVCVGDTLVLVEAMKMEHAIRARVSGTVARIEAAEGDQVAQGAVLVEIAAEEAD